MSQLPPNIPHFPKLYKITDRDGKTHDRVFRHGKSINQCGLKRQWGEGIEHCVFGKKKVDILGTVRYDPGLLLAYTDPLLASLLWRLYNVHIRGVRLWEAEGYVAILKSLTVRCVRLKTIREISVPEITRKQRTRCGILCAMEACVDDEDWGWHPGFHDWEKWATHWLDGSDKSIESASAASKLLSWSDLKGNKAAKVAVVAAHSAANYPREDWASARHAAEAVSGAVNAKKDLPLMVLVRRSMRVELSCA